MGNNNGGTGGSLLALILLGVAIWFFFFRVDYNDYWYDGDGSAYVTYCGNIFNQDCSAHPTEYLRVYHNEKAKAAYGGGYIHNFTIYFNNGGYIEAEGRCAKAADSLSFDRVCYVDSVSDSRESYRYEIHN